MDWICDGNELCLELFVVECEYWFTYRRMFADGWTLLDKKSTSRNGLNGYLLKLVYNYGG